MGHARAGGLAELRANDMLGCAISGGTIVDEIDLYEAAQRKSLELAMKDLGLGDIAQSLGAE